MSVQPNNKMNLMIITQNHCSLKVKMSNKELFEEIQSDIGSDEKYIYYLEKLSFYSYQVSD